MPQLITIPYNHTYLSILFIFFISFLFFLKNLIPILLVLTKTIILIIINNIKYNLCDLFFLKKNKNVQNTYSKNINIIIFLCNMIISLNNYIFYKKIKFNQLFNFNNNNIYIEIYDLTKYISLNHNIFKK